MIHSLQTIICLDLVKEKTLIEIIEYVNDFDNESNPIMMSACFNSNDFWKAVVAKFRPLLVEQRGDIVDYHKFAIDLVNDNNLTLYLYVRQDVRLITELKNYSKNPVFMDDHVDHVSNIIKVKGTPIIPGSFVFSGEYMDDSVHNRENDQIVFVGKTFEDTKNKFYDFLAYRIKTDIEAIPLDDDVYSITSLDVDETPISKDISLDEIKDRLAIYNSKNLNPQQVSIFKKDDGVIVVWISWFEFKG
jgi:hypothetical protein